MPSRGWTPEEERDLRRIVASRCWKKKDGTEASPEELEALVQRVMASGPPERPDLALLATAEAMGMPEGCPFISLENAQALKEMRRRKEG